MSTTQHTGVAFLPEAAISPTRSPSLAPPDGGADLALLAELHDRALLLDRCAARISRTAEGAARLALLRERLLLSMRAAGLPERRWVRVGRFGLYLEPRPAPASSPTAAAYRLRTAPWAAVRLAFVARVPVDTLRRGRRGPRILQIAAYRLRAYVRRSAQLHEGSGS